MTEVLTGEFSDGPVHFHISAFDDDGNPVEVDYSDLFDLVAEKLGEGARPCGR